MPITITSTCSDTATSPSSSELVAPTSWLLANQELGQTVEEPLGDGHHRSTSRVDAVLASEDHVVRRLGHRKRSLQGRTHRRKVTLGEDAADRVVGLLELLVDRCREAVGDVPGFGLHVRAPGSASPKNRDAVHQGMPRLDTEAIVLRRRGLRLQELLGVERFAGEIFDERGDGWLAL